MRRIDLSKFEVFQTILRNRSTLTPIFLRVVYTFVSGLGFRWRIVGDMTGWLGSSVGECSHGQRKALGSIPGRATIFHLLHFHFTKFK